MSDEAKEVAAEAPAETSDTQPAAPEAPATDTGEGKDSSEPGPRTSPRTRQRRQALERASSLADKAEAARRRAMEQPRENAGATTDEGEPAGGRFKKGEAEAEPRPEPETAAEPEAEGEAQADTQADGDEPPEPASEAAPDAEPEPEAAPAESGKTVRIPLPDDHPFRARGVTEWDAPAERENETRAMLNAVAERHQLRKDLEAEREQAQVLQARLKAAQSDLPYQPSPRMEHLLADIENNYSAEEAELIKRGLDSLNERTLTDAEMAARRHVAEQRQGAEFYETVHSQAAKRFPVWANRGVLKGYMDSAIRQWGARVDRENAARAEQGLRPLGLDSREFFRWASTKYVEDPAVLADMQSREAKRAETEREKIRREERERLEAEEKKKLAEAAERQKTLPPAAPGAASAGTVRSQVESAGSDEPKTRTERRRAIRERYAGR